MTIYAATAVIYLPSDGRCNRNLRLRGHRNQRSLTFYDDGMETPNDCGTVQAVDS